MNFNYKEQIFEKEVIYEGVRLKVDELFNQNKLSRLEEVINIVIYFSKFPFMKEYQIKQLLKLNHFEISDNTFDNLIRLMIEKRLINAFIYKGDEKKERYICLDICGKYLMESVGDMNQCYYAKCFSVIKNRQSKYVVDNIIKSVDFYLKIYQENSFNLKNFNIFEMRDIKRCQFIQTDFEFSIRVGGNERFFIGMNLTENDFNNNWTITKNKIDTLAILQSDSTNNWKKYYKNSREGLDNNEVIESNKPPVVLFIIEDDSLRKDLYDIIKDCEDLKNYRIMTPDLLKNPFNEKCCYLATQDGRFGITSLKILHSAPISI